MVGSAGRGARAKGDFFQRSPGHGSGIGSGFAPPQATRELGPPPGLQLGHRDLPGPPMLSSILSPWLTVAPLVLLSGCRSAPQAYPSPFQGRPTPTAARAESPDPGPSAAGAGLGGPDSQAALPSLAQAPLELPDLRTRLRSANPSLAEAASRWSASRASQSAAQRSAWPELSLGVDYLAADRPSLAFALALDQRALDFSAPLPNDLGRINNLHREVRLDWRLFDPARAPRLNAASAEVDLGRALALALERELHNELSAAWLTWLGENSVARAQAESVAATLARRAQVAARVELGAALQADLLRIDVRVATARQQLVATEAALARTRARLTQLVAWEEAQAMPLANPALTPEEFALAARATLQPGEIQTDAHQSWPLDPHTATEIARRQRPEVAAAEAQIRLAAADARASNRVWLPELGFSAAYAYDGSEASFDQDLDSSLMGLGLHWRLSASTSAAARAARQRQSAAEHRHADLLGRLRFEVSSAYSEMEAARANQALAESALAAASAANELMNSAYAQGAATLTDTLESDDQLRAARSAQVQAALQSALAELRVIATLGGWR